MRKHTLNARIKEIYPKALLKGQEVQIRNCRVLDKESERYEYLAHYEEPGMVINRWIEGKHIDFN